MRLSLYLSSKVKSIHVFFCSAIKDWSALPLEVNEVNYKQKFKKAIQSFLSTNARDIM